MPRTRALEKIKSILALDQNGHNIYTFTYMFLQVINMIELQRVV